jgi:argininosuccinate lyase
MPGFTHLQSAQPVTFGHHLHGLCRDARARPEPGARRAVSASNESPIGAAALAGTGFPIDRHQTAHALGFSRPTRNSLDTVSRPRFRARDALTVASICRDPPVAAGRRDRAVGDASVRLYTPLGRVLDRLVDHAAEEATRTQPNWCAPRQGRVNGALIALLTIMKGLPLDLFQGHAGRQGRHVFDAAESLSLWRLPRSAGMVRDHDGPQRCGDEGLRRASAHATATDLADWLVREC